MRNLNYIKNQNGLSLLPENGADAPQYGRSMIEMLGVLAIIGVLSVGGIAGYSKAMSKYRINKTIEQITLIAGNIRSFFAPQKTYRGSNCACDNGSCSGIGDGCPIIKKAKILPDEMITLDADGKITNINNAFGGKVQLFFQDKSNNALDQAFSIAYDIGNNSEACIELLTQDWTNANVSFIVVWFLDSIGNHAFTLPASVDQAAEICSHTKDDEEKPTSVEFYFEADIKTWKDENYGGYNFTWH